MKMFLSAVFFVALSGQLLADIQDPPASANGPTRKLGRGISNVLFGWSELPATVARVNQIEGNSAAATHGVVRGVGRSFARFGVGLYEMLLWPFPVEHGTFVPLLPDDIRFIHRGYAEFPPELGNESKYPYVRKY